MPEMLLRSTLRWRMAPCLGKEWHGRMEDQYADEQVNLVEGTAGEEMADEW
jgi:hypothetical protein